MRVSKVAGRVGLGLLLAVGAPGCIQFIYPHGIGEEKTSPDGLTTAYVVHAYFGCMTGINRGGKLWQEAWVYWRPADRPAAASEPETKWYRLPERIHQRGVPRRLVGRKLQVAFLGAKDYTNNLLFDVHVAFSPDSRRLAVVTPAGVKIIELDSGRSWQLQLLPSREGVSSMQWASDGQIVYVTHEYPVGEKPADLDPPSDSPASRFFTVNRMFWRHDVAEGPNGRVLVHSERFVTSRVWYWQKEFMSPRGAWVIYPTAMDDGQLRLLDVRTGRTRDIGSFACWPTVWWREDGKMALCRSRHRRHWRFLLVEPHAWRVEDVTEEASRVPEDDIPYHFSERRASRKQALNSPRN